VRWGNWIWVKTLDTALLLTVGIFAFSIFVFIMFGLFTLKLIRQHKDINYLLYALEEEEKKKNR